MGRDPETVSTLEVALWSPGSWFGPTVFDHVRQATHKDTRWSFPVCADEEPDLATEIDR